MFNQIKSAFVRGMETYFVQVEVDVSDGMPVFDMVGYLGAEVKEARERVRTAMRNQGVRIPPKRITINLSPANIRKEGTYFDLPIALAVIASLGKIESESFGGMLIIGELSLNGAVNAVCGILPIVARAREIGITRCMIPWENTEEAALVQGMEVYGIHTLAEGINYFQGNKTLTPVHIDVAEKQSAASELDFAQIAGQELTKRAAVIAAAGFHNLLMIGPPGAGKTMIASRIPSILPQMSWEESIEVTKIYSVVGLLSRTDPLVTKRPFRAPHHTITGQALAGGGMIPRPGEVTLAHKGVLFLDELPEFQKATLEMMRQPLEEGIVHISRIHGMFDYPADFMLVAAMNPCQCGYFPDFNRCSCSLPQVHRYLDRISRPLLDRIDLCVEVQEVSFDQLQERQNQTSSQELRLQVETARRMQKLRYCGQKIQFNSQLTAEGLAACCQLGEEEEAFMACIYAKYHLTVRSYHRILKVARTIADLEEAEKITMRHLNEAVCFRTVDQKFWTR